MIELDETMYTLLRAALASSIALGSIVAEVRTGRIPNGVTLGGLLAVVATTLATGRVLDALVAISIVVVPLGWAFLRRLVPGGLVKLAVALGASVGSRGALVLVLAVGLWVALETWQANQDAARRERLRLPYEPPPPLRSSPRLAVFALVGLCVSVAIERHTGG